MNNKDRDKRIKAHLDRIEICVTANNISHEDFDKVIWKLMNDLLKKT